MKLDANTAHKLRNLATKVRYRANDYDTFSQDNDYDTFSQDEEWQTRAGQMDRAADLLSEAARVLDEALVDGP